MNVTVSGDGMADIFKGLRFLKENQLLVGIPQDAPSRDDDEPTNAELAYIHSNGSPKHGIPARPFLEPALDQTDVQEKITKCMKEAAVFAIDGDESGAMRKLDDAGTYGEEAAKDYITSGDFAPNKPATIKRKGSSKPLIDTASMQNSITHVIEKR